MGAVESDKDWEDLRKKEWWNIFNLTKLLALYPRRLQAVLATKGAWTKWLKRLNAYINAMLWNVFTKVQVAYPHVTYNRFMFVDSVLLESFGIAICYLIL